MPDMVGVIKAEIARLAKKEAKAATTQLKRASVQYRSDIAKLRKRLGQQEKQLKLLGKQTQQHGQPQAEENPLDSVRFSARSVKAQRQRLGLSALDYGKLVGVSPLTVYSWEHGSTKPRQAQLVALVAVRGIGKREALTKLAELTAKRKPRRKRDDKAVEKVIVQSHWGENHVRTCERRQETETDTAKAKCPEGSGA